MNRMMGWMVALALMGGMTVRAAETLAERNAADPGKAVYDGWTLVGGKPEEIWKFSGLEAGTGYTLELEFLACSHVDKPFATIGVIRVGDETLASKVVVAPTLGNNPMPPAQRWVIPVSAIRDGQLTVCLQKLETEKEKKRVVPKDNMTDLNATPGTEIVAAPVFAIRVRVLTSKTDTQALSAVLPRQFEIPVVRLTPRPVQLAGVAPLKVDLGGAWQASLKPPAEFWKLTAVSGADWKQVQVPGELAMQGLEPDRETAAYWRQFDCPATWQGQRIKLKCDAIFNDAKIWINGQVAGAHVGNFTPFELDITGLIKLGGKNVITVAVRNNFLADDHAWASAFISHSPAGIVRKIYLFPTPAVNISDVHVLTDFDTEYRNGILTANVEVRNESDQPARNLQLRLGLRQRGKSQDSIEPVTATVAEAPAGRSVVQSVRFSVPEPQKWDVEHPNLYYLSVALLRDGQAAERVSERIGFRKIEIRGSQVFINNHPVKYHGVVWHETDLLRGRCLSGDDWRRDMKLLRGMNCNYIRFQMLGGPPAEELLEACDEMGVFIENELPVGWSGRGDKELPLILRAAVEMAMRDRSRASLVQWSMGNELRMGLNLLLAQRLAMKPLDVSRPYLLDGESFARGDVPLDIRNVHYTATKGVAAWAQSNIPVMEGEWAHPASYNRREVYTDPGVRDIWAYGVADKWEKMYAMKSCLGGSIWTGVDEYFLMPDGNVQGWGEYGFIDVWRRPKPEYWHFKKIFTPIFINTAALPLPAAGQPLRVPVENRYAFSDLSEVRFDWTLNQKSGHAAVAAAPGTKGVLEIPLPVDHSAGTLELKAFNTENMMVDAWRITLGPIKAKTAPTQTKQKVEWVKGEDRHRIRCGGDTWEIDAHTGMLVSLTRAGKTMRVNGPVLLVLPLSGEGFNRLTRPTEGVKPMWLTPGTDKFSSDIKTWEWFKSPVPLTATCSGWKAKSVEIREVGDAVEAVVCGEYKEAAGQFTLRFTPDGELNVGYDFALNKTLMATADVPCGIYAGKLRPRQLGVVFDLPKECDTLTWRRQAQWTYYPDDHIGRPEGRAKAFPSGIPICQGAPFYRTQPSWSWSQDTTPQGSADFRSTKANIREASLTDGSGAGLRVLSDGKQHVRAWADGAVNHLLVADINCEGCLVQFFPERILPGPSFKSGDHVKGEMRYSIINEKMKEDLNP